MQSDSSVSFQCTLHFIAHCPHSHTQHQWHHYNYFLCCVHTVIIDLDNVKPILGYKELLYKEIFHNYWKGGKFYYYICDVDKTFTNLFLKLPFQLSTYLACHRIGRIICHTHSNRCINQWGNATYNQYNYKQLYHHKKNTNIHWIQTLYCVLVE